MGVHLFFIIGGGEIANIRTRKGNEQQIAA
jgi:hypothetical protein